MFIRNGQLLGSGVPRDKRGIPAPAERTTTVPVSPGVARSIKKARSRSESPSKSSKVTAGGGFGKVEKAAPSEQEAEQQAAESPQPVESVEPPKEYATKTDWVDYAVSCGADRGEAESLTKTELIDLYGGD